MSLTRPRSLQPDATLPVLLDHPELALTYVGRKVCKNFAADLPGGGNANLDAWFVGIVKGVSFDEGTAFFQIVYEDGDDEEMWWQDFRQWAVVDSDAGLVTPGPGALHTQPGPDGAGGSPLPKKRRTVAPRNAQTLQPGSSHGAAHRAAGRGSAGRPLSEEHEAQDADPEGARPAVRRRLDLDAQQLQDVFRANGGTADHVKDQVQHRTVRPPPRRTLAGPEALAAGHLNRIQLVNFMCHENLEVNFNKYVTFVSGRNGSGKSALLQGLQACLGASARDTGRGTSLAAWVQKEKRMAVVTLEIWNTTPDEVEVETQPWPAFRHEIYGSLIRIVRKITASDADEQGNRTVTSSTYQLYRADGSEVKPAEMGQSAAKEVAALAEHFNIDASNPLIVITQDMARQFHQATGRGARCKKYEMYMRGTCLTATRDTLAKAAENVRCAGDNTRSQWQRLREKRDEVKALERRQEQLQQVDVCKQHLADVDMAIVWVVVEEARGNLKRSKDEAATIPARISALERRLAQDESTVADLQNSEAALRDEMENTRSEELPARLQHLNSLRQAAKRRRLDIIRRKEETEGMVRELQDRKASQGEDLARLQSQRNSEELLQRVREHMAAVERKQADLVELQTAATQLESNRTALSSRLTDAEAALAERTTALDATRSAAREAREVYAQLRSAAGGNGEQAHAINVRLWGAGPMALHAAVRAAPPGTFTQPPIGPVGLYLRRRADCEPELARVLDLALRHCLDVWLVNQRRDSDALRALADSISCRRPDTIAAPFQARVYNYGQNPVVEVNNDGQQRTWRRLIDLVEPVEGLPPMIHATLINTLLNPSSGVSAANVAIVETREEGQWVATGSNQVLVNRRVRSAYDVNGTFYESRGNGALIITSQNQLPRVPRLVPDNRAQLEESALAVQAREAELQQAVEARREAQEAVDSIRREQQALRQRQMELSREQSRTQSQLESLLEQAPTAVSEAQSQSVLNALQQTQQELARLVASHASLDSELNNAAAEVESIAAEVEALHKQSEQYRARREELMAQLSQLAQQKLAATEQLGGRREQLEQARRDMQTSQERINEYERKVEEAVAAADEICTRDEGRNALEALRTVKAKELEDRFPNKSEEQRAVLLARSMTSQGLQHWSGALTQKISRAVHEAGGDLEGIGMQLGAARKDRDRLKVAVESVAEKVISMEEAQALRNGKYEFLLKQVEQQSNTKFARYMNARNIIASLHLDHEEERLDLRVRKINEQQRATSLMQLSGGERSFTTAAFLLAMGEVLQTPFRAMDEYDVYMDPAARKVATIALLEYAWKSNRNSQLVLLSPQDTATLTEALESLMRTCEKERDGRPPPKDFVKIVELRDPRARTT